MRKTFSFVSLVVLFASICSAPSSHALFGVGDCGKLKKQIASKESLIQRDLRYVVNLQYVLPSINSAQGTKLYGTHQRLQNTLYDVRSLGQSKPKCFTSGTNVKLANPQFFEANYYVAINALDTKYGIYPQRVYAPLVFK